MGRNHVKSSERPKDNREDSPDQANNLRRRVVFPQSFSLVQVFALRLVLGGTLHSPNQGVKRAPPDQSRDVQR
jgi:hypothetical protein